MKTKRFVLLGIIVLFVACTANLGNVPWHLDIQNWSMYQKANFFMNTWMAEKNSYDTMNDMDNKPDDLIKVLEAKRKILEDSRVPIRLYVHIVKAGNTPDINSEQEIIDFLRQLQMQYLYGG
jgi:hypothetical protein